MKPFSLEEYLKNPSRKVITRDGTPVKIHCTNYLGANPIIAEIEGSGQSRSFKADGKHFSVDESVIALFFAPEKHEGWVNIFKNISSGNHYIGDSRVFKSKEDAEKEGMKYIDYVSTIKVEWEE